MRRNHPSTLTLAQELARPTHGLVSRQLLRTHGIDRHALRRLANRGDVAPHGGHAVHVCAIPWEPSRSPVVAAVINSGPNAWAEGHAALVLAGLTGHDVGVIDVGVPENAASRQVAQVRRHRLRATPPLRYSPVLHTEPAHAALRAAAWAESDIAATDVLAACVRQCLVPAERLHELARSSPSLARRGFVLDVLQDLSRRHPSLVELDLPRLCRRRGLPEPDVVTMRQNIDGEFALEAYWHDLDVTVHVEPFTGTAGADEEPGTFWTRSGASAGRVLHIGQSDLQGQPQPFFAALEQLLRGRHEGEERS